MNPFSMVLWIVALSLLASIVHKLLDRSHDKKSGNGALEKENDELRREIEAMRERVQTLERITVERENSLAREIEDLRKTDG